MKKSESNTWTERALTLKSTECQNFTWCSFLLFFSQRGVTMLTNNVESLKMNANTGCSQQLLIANSNGFLISTLLNCVGGDTSGKSEF